MLYLNVSDAVLAQSGKSIDHYFALHLGGFSEDIKSVNLLIEEVPLIQQHGVLYRCELHLIPKHGHAIKHVVDREHCVSAIEHSFAKAKRAMQRRLKGINFQHDARLLG